MRRKEEERRRWHEQMGDKQEEDKKDDLEHLSEEGIVVMNSTATRGKTWMFYEDQDTQAHFVQCSYSACRCAREKGAVEIEEKMRKWRARLDSQESFDCTLMDPNHEESDESYEDDDEEPHRMHHMMKFAALGSGIVWVILLVVLMVRRCRAWKVMNAATPTPTQVYAAPNAPNAKEVEANLPPSAKEVEANLSMSKEEEANMPPVYSQEEELANAPSSAPAVVWTTHNLPTYEGATEQPPEYKSQVDMRAMTPVDGERA